jgi:hypothetical protein
LRIARELDDIVAHAVSVIVLQVGRSGRSCPRRRRRIGRPWGRRAGARAALAEMRRLLGVLRDEGADVELTPRPGLDNLDVLVEKDRLAGLPSASTRKRPRPAPTRTRCLGVPHRPTYRASRAAPTYAVSASGRSW